MYCLNSVAFPFSGKDDLYCSGALSVSQEVVVSDAQYIDFFVPECDYASDGNTETTCDYILTKRQCNVAVCAAKTFPNTSFSLKTELIHTHTHTPSFSLKCSGSQFSVINENKLQQLSLTVSGFGFAAPKVRKRIFVHPAVRAVKHCTAQIYLHKGVFRL